MPPSLTTLILLSIFWVILFLLWIRILIWDIKLTEINEKLESQLSQALEELQRLQSKGSSPDGSLHQPSSCNPEIHLDNDDAGFSG